MRRKAKGKERAGLMQSAAKKRPSFSGEIHFEGKENRAKLWRVPTATVLLPFSGPIPPFFLSRQRRQVATWLRYSIIPEERKAPANSGALIKFFLFALGAVTSFGSSTHSNALTRREPFTWDTVV